MSVPLRNRSSDTNSTKNDFTHWHLHQFWTPTSDAGGGLCASTSVHSLVNEYEATHRSPSKNQKGVAIWKRRLRPIRNAEEKLFGNSMAQVEVMPISRQVLARMPNLLSRRVMIAAGYPRVAIIVKRWSPKGKRQEGSTIADCAYLQAAVSNRKMV